MFKKLLCFAAAFLLAMNMSGCGNQETQTTGERQSLSGQQDKQTESASGQTSETPAQSSAESGAYNVTWEDMADVNIIYCSMGPAGTGVQAVADEINKITEEYNIHVNLTQMDIGSYEQQVSLMISSNEPVDLLVTLPGGPCSFSTMGAQGQLRDITDLMETYAPKTLAGIGDFMKGTMLEDKIYGVTCYKNFAGCIYIHMRTDVLEDLGLLEKAQNMTTLTEYEEILEAVKNSEKWNQLSGIGCKISALQGAYLDADAFAQCTYSDNLGDTQFLVAADPGGDDLTVKLNYETEAYKKTYDRFKSWNTKGYMYKDMGISAEGPSELVKSNVIFSYIVQSESGPTANASTSASCGMPMTSVKVMDLPISTGSITKFVWAVPSTAKAPEAAVTFLEMMYSDSRIANLMAWGIEDIDYELDEQGVAHYIEGNENPAYHGADYLTVNKFIVAPWEGSPADLNTQEAAIMDNAILTPYLGFMCDTSEISTQTSMVSNIVNEYDSQVGTGMADEAVYDEFIAKLKSSGAEDIVAQYQTQLDQWMAE